MCAWWRVAAMAAVTLAWPGLLCAQQEGNRWPTDVSRGDASMGFAAVPAQDAQASWPSITVAHVGWPGLATTEVVRPWSTLQGRWHFASLVDQSYAADWAAPVPSPITETTIVPVVASYRLGSSYRIALSWGIVSHSLHADGRAAGVWSMKPRVAYTRELSAESVDSSTIVAVGTFSRQAVANYQNGAVGRIEALVMRRNADGWGFGGVAAAIQPYNTITTPIAGRLPNSTNGGGYALGVGPQLNWSTRWMGSGVDVQYRWIHEFRAPNGHTDQPMLLSATLHL
ncbi:hypothetical protein SAMN04487785_109116 [Dyella jiangningensis]|uniref:hypothetical protein n=1 Tax=Dyella sp. AtDHG13 TaxID=1938897 RepID=UPI00088B3682|nr:hypothetical protein [Dyella sp. AtDHG13]PXV56992.1 hypothetical protein BDW41_108114 [Dyella sp. AtDHG13]SDK63259.1 hypothetical protein SAMN04487785_109116 [Dyella jiangningensis]